MCSGKPSLGTPLSWRNPRLESCWTLAHARAVRNSGLVYELAFAPSYPSDARVDICAYRVKLRARDDELEANLGDRY